jgi:transmembrane sensor
MNKMKEIEELIENYKQQKMIHSEAAWSKLSRRIRINTLIHKVWDIGKTAAVLLLPLLLIYQYVIMPNRAQNNMEMIHLISAPGIVTNVALPDGSRVWLNSQSELTYPSNFHKNERTIQLKGEAFFQVTSDKKNRFNVETSEGVVVSAYGTEFNVSAFEGDANAVVTLVKGKIETAHAHSESRTLLEGQKAIVDTNRGNIEIMDADTYVETAWIDGKMVFRREKLENIAVKLSRKFGVSIQLEGDAIKEWEYTATFQHETLDDILLLLQRSAPITYTITRQEQLDNKTFSKTVVTIRSK